ncbi:MAG: hypothetical protein U5K79_01985 [Cyclobacteriaceae bacterium]|nr:hypothetical protein [Cyclobacteriaceae bacterium]
MNKRTTLSEKEDIKLKLSRKIKEALTIDQIKEIMQFEVEPGSTQQLAKGMWLLLFL